MSRSSKSTSMNTRQMEEHVSQFCSVTGASVRDARRYLEQYYRLDMAIDAFYTERFSAMPRHGGASSVSTTKLNQLFDSYKDPDGEDISIDGTIKFCQDLGVDPEDVVLLAIAYELKSPRMGDWSRKGWVDGWKALGCDNISAMQTALTRLRTTLGSSTGYFRQVYNYTFEFSRPSGQRSLALDMAQGFWAILIPHGLDGGALAHVIHSEDDEDEDDEDEDMVGSNGDGDRPGEVPGPEQAEGGWTSQHTQWWFEFLDEKGGKGISKDTWQMFLEFVRTIDSKFEKYDTEAAWPSTLDDFVDYARQRLGSSS